MDVPVVERLALRVIAPPVGHVEHHDPPRLVVGIVVAVGARLYEGAELVDRVLLKPSHRKVVYVDKRVPRLVQQYAVEHVVGKVLGDRRVVAVQIIAGVQRRIDDLVAHHDRLLRRAVERIHHAALGPKYPHIVRKLVVGVEPLGVVLEQAHFPKVHGGRVAPVVRRVRVGPSLCVKVALVGNAAIAGGAARRPDLHDAVVYEVHKGRQELRLGYLAVDIVPEHLLYPVRHPLLPPLLGMRLAGRVGSVCEQGASRYRRRCRGRHAFRCPRHARARRRCGRV